MPGIIDRKFSRLAIAAALAASSMYLSSSHAALTDLTSVPLGTSVNGGAVKPNILFILDGSGSMNFQFAPDNVDPVNASGNVLGLNQAYTCRADNLGFNNCDKGDPPYQADMFNGLSYNPQVRYRPGVSYTGGASTVSRGDMNAAATTNWTSASTNSYFTEEGVAATTMNMTTSWFQNGWCTVSGCSNIRFNGVHNAVNGTFAYATPPKPSITGVSFTRSGSTVTGTKAGHNVAVNDFIDVVAGTCSAQAVKVTAATASTFSYTSGDSSVAACSGVTGTVTFSATGYPEPAPIALAPTTAVSRSGTTITVTYPGHNFQVGDQVNITGGNANGSPLATASVVKLASVTASSVTKSSNTVTVTTSSNHGLATGNIVDVVGGGVDCTATAIAVTVTGTNTFTFPHANRTACSGSYTVNPYIVTVTTSAAHGLSVGEAVDVVGGGAACASTSVAVMTLIGTTGFTYTASATGACSGTYTVNKKLCNTGQPGATITTLIGSAPNYTGFTVTLAGNTVACAGTYNVSRKPANILKSSNTNPYYFALTPTEYCSDEHLTDCIAATAPTAANIPGRPNGGNVNFVYPAYVRYCNSLAAATAAPIAPSSAPSSAPSGASIACVDKYYSPTYVYARYGRYNRTDIVSTTATYTNRPNRSDCAAAPNCTYAEEMTNFANWLAYYRRRIMSMKTAVGLAFSGLDSRYRVGFMLIEFGSQTSAVNCTKIPCETGTEFLPVTDFDATQKQKFYSAMYQQAPKGGTPLRRALSRAGRYFAKQTSGINGGLKDDPVQYSCQQNFALLTTDGMWKSYTPGDGVKLDGTTAIGNQDNDPADPSGMVNRASGTYDGACAAGDVTTTGGCANTLADVAMYYYKTDLRTVALGNTSGALGQDVSPNNVPTSDGDKADWQHMVTFTVALVDGLMNWTPDYQTAATGDYKNITTGASGCWWSGSGACNWPTVTQETPSALDDLWHAAVNGHGQYFHAADANAITTGLVGALNSMAARTASAAASATSSPNVTQQDNVIYSTTYETVDWSGQLVAQYIDTTTGNVQAGFLWQAQSALDARVGPTTATRQIYTFDPSASNHLQSFDYNSMGTEKGWLDNACSPVGKLSQCATLSGPNLTWINNGLNITNFVRGMTQNEGTGILRDRLHALGDTVNATPIYVRAPLMRYGDAVNPSYAKFKSDWNNRPPVIYLAANDGMMHAFDAQVGGGANGQELWAYVPRMLIPNLYKLADTNYATKHAFFVDGSPTVMDAFNAGDGNWHTVLIGGLNNGGRGYYALDITNPSSPRALWEFCNDSTYCTLADPNLGYTYGNPIITKLANGTWVAIVTSGYNNVSPGDGVGHLYVLDLFTGSKLYDVATGTSSATTLATPTGLGRISAWSDNFTQDNTVKYVYGGDLRGNIWRFDFTGAGAPAVTLLGTAVDANGRAQSITTRPELGMVNGSRVVYVGTGRYLGTSDLTDPSTQLPLPNPVDAWQQSLYAIKDTGASYGVLRTNVGMVKQQIIVKDPQTRTSSNNGVDWSLKNGWFVDFNAGNNAPGERVNIDPMLVNGTLNVKTNVPVVSSCSVGGDSWVYQFRFDTGEAVPTSPGGVLAQKITGAATVGFVIVSLPNGSLKDIITLATGEKKTWGVNVSGTAGTPKRVGWRELAQ